MTKLKNKLQIQTTLAMMTKPEPPKTKECLTPSKIKRRNNRSKITINSCTMSLPIDQAFNNITQSPETTEVNMDPPSIEGDKGTTQVESSRASNSGSSSDYEPTAEVLLTQSLVQNPQFLQMATALFEYRNARDTNQLPPMSPTNSEAPSTTTTENLHPGWPYITHTDLNYDLPPENYERPYLVAIMNPINGDPRVISNADREGAPYNEAELVTQPVDNIEEDVKEGVGGEYGVGEDAYLNSQFLMALGSLADQGLNAECLRMVQAECEKCSLERWKGHLEAREKALLTERQGYQQAKRVHNTWVADIKIRLRRAKFASRMTPLLQDHPGIPAFAFPSHMGAHIVTGERSQNRRGPCHWCRGRGLDMYQAKDCEDPHKRYRILHPGRCLVPEHHSGYWARIIAGNECPYDGNHHRAMPRGDYT